MRTLILGGTIFLGRHIVEAALARGHEVVLFNRGRHNPEFFPELERLRGDRDGDLRALEGRRFDAVIDTCGFVPRIVRASAELLGDACEHYTFVSSLSVFPDAKKTFQDEQAPLAQLEDETVEEVTGETYGGLKALCEAAVERALPGRALNVRPGLIVGPHDPTDRFTYWVERVARGGAVLAPAPENWKVEFTDVRDLSKWIVHAAEERFTGPFNASGPAPEKVAFGEFLNCCREVASSDASFQWADEQWLTEQGVEMWTDLPLRTLGDSPGFSTRSTQKAVDAGLRFRPMSETIADTLAWWRTRDPAPLKAGLTPDRESELLAKLQLS
ncbi:MAG: NAD-dependent epimerase/dehydratase family protein [Planctomycetota bacterium]